MRLGFSYNLRCIDQCECVRWSRTLNNIVPAEGAAYILRAAFDGGIQYYPWHIGIYENAYAPSPTDTLGSLLSNCGEITSYVSTGNKRPELLAGILNRAVWGSRAETAFTFTDTRTVSGVFLTSSSVRGDTNGVLLSVVRLGSPEIVESGQTLYVSAGVVLYT